MDEAQKARLVEEAKQRSFGDIIEKAHQGSNAADAIQLRDEIIKVGINEAGTLRGLVDQVFDKVLSDGTTAQTLAELCQVMPAHFEPVEVAAPKEKGAGSRGTSEKRIDLRLMIVKKCKEELEKGVAVSKLVKAWDAKEADKELNGEEKKLAEADRKSRGRMLELIRFCGYLYNMGLVTEKIIHSCIDVLLKDSEEPRYEDVETVTSLFKIIGAKLDGSAKSTKDGKIVAEYFKSMEKIKENAVSAQIASMMEEVLTLKSSGWVAVA